MTFIPGY